MVKKSGDKMNVNSMLFWYPKIENIVPTPKTAIYEFDGWEYLKDGYMMSNEWKELLNVVTLTARKLGYPVFIRTDHESAKHEWLHTCYVENEKSLTHNLHDLIDASICHDRIPNAIAVREFLHLDAPFKAFDGMPIAREFRYFSSKDGITCRHPYWFKEAIEFHRDTKPVDEWEEMIKDLETPPTDINIADALALKATSWCDEEWSVDICKDIHGKWWVTDMARGKDSSHHPFCPKTTESDKRELELHMSFRKNADEECKLFEKFLKEAKE